MYIFRNKNRVQLSNTKISIVQKENIGLQILGMRCLFYLNSEDNSISALLALRCSARNGEKLEC